MNRPRTLFAVTLFSICLHALAVFGLTLITPPKPKNQNRIQVSFISQAPIIAPKTPSKKHAVPQDNSPIETKIETKTSTQISTQKIANTQLPKISTPKPNTPKNTHTDQTKATNSPNQDLSTNLEYEMLMGNIPENALPTNTPKPDQPQATNGNIGHDEHKTATDSNNLAKPNRPKPPSEALKKGANIAISKIMLTWENQGIQRDWHNKKLMLTIELDDDGNVTDVHIGRGDIALAESAKRAIFANSPLSDVAGLTQRLTVEFYAYVPNPNPNPPKDNP